MHIFCRETRRKGAHLEHIGLDRRIILKWIVWEAVDWILLASERDNFRAFYFENDSESSIWITCDEIFFCPTMELLSCQRNCDP